MGWVDFMREDIVAWIIQISICLKEANIFRMIYNNQGCDSFEDIFRDFNMVDVNDKILGVQLAIDSLVEQQEDEEVLVIEGRAVSDSQWYY